MQRQPNSRANLDRAIQRFAKDYIEANRLRGILANLIVAQMMPEGVVKGGSGLNFRYGKAATRYTEDLDTAWQNDLDGFLKGMRENLSHGWSGFAGEVHILKQASPKGLPFDYVMQPCAVKLSYMGKAWYTVDLEIGHNEIGDADAYDEIEVPEEIARLTEFLSLPPLNRVRVMKLEYQVAQKLHGASGVNSQRAHDLIDLQLIMARAEELDFPRMAEICKRLFIYRRKQPWPAKIVANEGWDTAYETQRLDLPVLSTAEEAVAWANDLIDKIAKA